MERQLLAGAAGRLQYSEWAYPDPHPAIGADRSIFFLPYAEIMRLLAASPHVFYAH